MAESKGIIICDTKLELGLENDRIIVIDELLTPDSSRFWPLATYQVGSSPESFDKQYVRDYLLNIHWDVNTPPPVLPPEVVQKTREKYTEALKRLTAD
jgi:phosphoribosylaminoimidazole-succinocarboxamide synthase